MSFHSNWKLIQEGLKAFDLDPRDSERVRQQQLPFCQGYVLAIVDVSHDLDLIVTTLGDHGDAWSGLEAMANKLAETLAAATETLNALMEEQARANP